MTGKYNWCRVYPTLPYSREGFSEIVYVAMKAVNKKMTIQGRSRTGD